MVESVNARHENARFLPGVPLHAALRATNDAAAAARGAELVVYVTPSHVLRGVMKTSAAGVSADATVVVATKGIERDTLALMTEVALQELAGTRRGRALRSELRRRGRRRPADRRRRRVRGHRCGTPRPARAQLRPVPRLHQRRCDRRRAGRRLEERDRDRHRHRRGARSGIQSAGRAHHARPRGDRAPRRRLGRVAAHLRGTRRDGRPRAHVHRRAEPQPAARPRDREGHAARRGARPAARRWPRA